MDQSMELQQQKRQEIQTQKTEQQLLRDERLMTGDKQAIGAYSDPKYGDYKASSKKSSSRNYRDYELYRQSHPELSAAYGERQEAVDYAQTLGGLVRDVNAQRDALPLAAGERQLSISGCLQNISRCGLLKKSLKNEEIKLLADNLYAGGLRSAQPDPNASANRLMQAQGVKALGGIYRRQILALDEKYGESFYKMSVSDYLKAQPQLEEDFASIEDMKTFFTSYAPEALENEQALMAKLDYYRDCYTIMRQRSAALVADDQTQVDDKGELTKAAELDYRSRLRSIHDDGKSVGTFKKLKLPEGGVLQDLSYSSEMKKAALNTKTAIRLKQQAREAEARDNDARIDALVVILGKVRSYETAKNALKKPGLSEKRLAHIERTIRVYENDPELVGVNEKSILQELNRRQQGDGLNEGYEDISEENAAQIADKIADDITEFVSRMDNLTDEDLVKNYSRLVTTANGVNAMAKNAMFSEHLVQANNKYQEHESGEKPLEGDELESVRKRALAYRRCQKATSDYGSYYINAEELLSKRLDDIAKFGCSRRREVLDRSEDATSRAEELKAQQKTVQKQPISFDEAKKVEIETTQFTWVLSKGKTLDMSKVMDDFAALRTIKAQKEQDEDVYRLGQPYNEYLRCEALLKLLPVYERLFSVFLRLNRVDGEGTKALAESSHSELMREFNETQEQFVDEIISSDITKFAKEDTARALSESLDRQHSEEERKLLGLADMYDEELSPELIERIQTQQGISFLDIKDKETCKKQVKAVKSVLDFSAGVQPGQFVPVADRECVKSALTLAQDFTHEYDTVMQSLLSGGKTLSDAKLANNSEALSKLADMARFLKKHMTETGLAAQAERMAQSEEFGERDVFLLHYLEEKLDNAMHLSGYSTGLCMLGAKSLELPSLHFSGPEGREEATSPEQIEIVSKFLIEDNEHIVHKLRADIEVDRNREQLEDINLRAKVRSQVGKELLADEQSDKWVNVRSFMEWGGNRMGGLMQLLSWTMREKRTADHGECRYDESVKKARELEEKLPCLEDSELPDYQRGDPEYAPKIELSKYYESALKKSLLAELTGQSETISATSDLDFLEEEFSKAIEAIGMYTKVVGIVNSDTTEMEMAFLQTFNTQSAAYLETNEGCGEETIEKKCALLRRLRESLGGALGGTLSETISEKELALIEESTTSYYEDTTFSANMTESNIKDIPLFTHEPNLNDVRQSTIGDCWLVSAMSTVVKTNPDFIRSMFHDCGDGNVIVRLYSAQTTDGRRVEHKRSVMDEGVSLTPCYFKLKKHYETGWGNASDCCWTQLLEKAYALGGFNTRNEMQIKGDRLYNVANELTMGEINAGICHLTGQKPQELSKYDGISNEDIISPDILKCLLSELPERPRTLIEPVLEDLLEQNFSIFRPSEKQSYTFKSLCEDISVHAATIAPYMHNVTEEEFTEEYVQNCNDELIAAMTSAYEKMLAGTPIQFPSRHEYEAQTVKVDGVSPLEHRQKVARFFKAPRCPGYPEPVVSYYLSCKEALEKGGGISIGIPHCVNIVDAQEKNGRLFFLMRDPFNIYNTEYEKLDGRFVGKSEALKEVYTRHEGNRRLVGDGTELIHCGFRGTSWIEASELFSQISETHILSKQQAQPPHAD